MNCLHNGCKRPAVTGGQYCYYSHDGTIETPTKCLVAKCNEPTGLASNLCEDHGENYYLWRKRQRNLSKFKGENTLLVWLSGRLHLRGAK